MKIIFITLFLFIATSSIAQSIKDTIVTKSTINYDSLILYCVGMDVKIYDKADQVFERTFKVQYVIFGCTPTLPDDKMRANNKLVANYLDKKYGLIWRKQLRFDAFAITK